MNECPRVPSGCRSTGFWFWALASLLGAGMGWLEPARAVELAAEEVAAEAAPAPLGPRSFVELAKRVLPAVVEVGPPRVESAEESRELQREFDELAAGGSGFLIDADGSLLTSFHVIEAQAVLEVRLADGRVFPARVLGADARMDIALLQVEGAGSLPYLPLGRSADLEVGEVLAAVGSPFGLAGSFSTGVVSGLNRDLGLSDFDQFIQTDAMVNPGNSGGPLVNLAGEVVGVNTAVLADAPRIGFAIPIDLVVRFLPDLRSLGRIQRGFVGVQVQAVTPELVQSLALPQNEGVLVTGTVSGSAAERAGLRPEDLIVAVDGEVLSSPRALRLRVTRAPVGSKLVLLVLRAGAGREFMLTVGEWRADGAARAVPPSSPLGLELMEADASLRRELKLPWNEGLLVIDLEPGGAAERAGLRVGDLLLRGESPVGERIALGSLRDFEKVVRTFEEKGQALLLLQRGPKRSFVVLQGAR